MESILIVAGLTILSGLLGFMGWLGMAVMKHVRSDGHQSPRERDAVTKAIEEQIKAHSDMDDQRFRTIEKMLEEMRSDIKTLLERGVRKR